MSHIDEGELTAYADGAYEPADAKAQRIEAHLSECVNCRNRLAQARDLSGRAAEILAAAALFTINAPPFEDISKSAAVPQSKPRMLPIAWAATVILALGLGWLARGIPSTPQQQLAKARAESPAIDRTETSSSPAPPRVAARPDTTPLVVAAQQSSRNQTNAPADQRKHTTDEPIAGNVSGGIAAAAPPAATPAPVTPPPAATALQERTEDSAEFRKMMAQGAARIAALSMSAAEAERQGIKLHVIPELEVLRVSRVADTTVVQQKLTDGTVVTISSVEPRALPFRRDNSAEQKSVVAPRAQREAGYSADATVMRDGTLIRVTGSLPPDSLRALAAKVR